MNLWTIRNMSGGTEMLLGAPTVYAKNRRNLRKLNLSGCIIFISDFLNILNNPYSTMIILNVNIMLALTCSDKYLLNHVSDPGHVYTRQSKLIINSTNLASLGSHVGF